MDQALECEMVNSGGMDNIVTRCWNPWRHDRFTWGVNMEVHLETQVADLVVSCGLSDQKKPKKDRL